MVILACAAIWGKEEIDKHLELTQFENSDAARQFLTDAGFNETTAEILMKQSDELGLSPVPVLMKYGELKGLTQEEIIDWVNALTATEEGAENFEILCNSFNDITDSVQGDLSGFTETTSDYAGWKSELDEWVAQNKINIDAGKIDRYFILDTNKTKSLIENATSADQIDYILSILEISEP